MKKNVMIVANFVLALVATIMGIGGDVMMAAAAALPDAGKTESGTGAGEAEAADGGRVEKSPVNLDGIATETFGRENGDANLYLNDVDQRIVKIRPMATPIDNISRYAKNSSTDSMIAKYYSTGTRPIKCTLATATAETSAATAASSFVLPVSDPTMFTVDDTIRVVGVKGYKIGTTEHSNEDLVLCVCGRDDSTSNPVVYAVNGIYSNNAKANIILPQLTEGAVLVRMGKACGELDVQTGRFNNLPTPEENYCQNFMIQVEQSTFDKIAAKEVNWNFSDIEEDGIYDMRLAQENTYLFGVKNCIKHITKDGAMTWFTQGIWNMAGQDLSLGTYDAVSGKTTVSDDDLVDFSKDLFVGTGVGNKQKVLFCGSAMLAALSKIKSEKFRLKESVEAWNLRFKSWETDFGEILTIHHELFDINGMSDQGFALDPDYLSKKTHISWTRNVLDLKAAGVRNTDAVVLQEVACIYLRYAKAHARVHLATAADTI